MVFLTSDVFTRQVNKMSDTNKSLINLSRKISVWRSLIAAFELFVFGIATLLFNMLWRDAISILGILELVLSVVVAVVGLVTAKRRQDELTKEIEQFSFCTEYTTKAAVMSFPSPMVVAGVNGSVLWYNTQFEIIVGRKSFFDEYVQDIFPELQFSRFVEDENPTPVEYSYKGHDYMITGRAVRTRLDEVVGTMVALYFTDLTDINRMRRQLEDKKVVVCSVLVDNYEETFKSTPNSNHGVLIAEIERCVNDWTDSGEGVTVRYERDRFMSFFEAAKFEPLQQAKFTVLEKVKEIQQGNRFPVTVSVGVGKSGANVRENEQMSQAALDMALGRGGDQAVVKTVKGFQFYGAKSREIAKSTKVKPRVVAHSLRDLADQASSVIIMGHKNGDADSFGASVGLFRGLRAGNVDAYIALEKTHNNAGTIVSGLLANDEYSERIVDEDRALSLIDEKTLLIVVDTHRPSMVEYRDVLRNIQEIVLIDHHRRSEEFIENTVLSYHEPYASSSSEMVTEILQYFSDGNCLEPYEAEALYCGIYMDTKGFTFKTGSRTFEAASYLRRIGADPVNVRRIFQNDLGMYVRKSRIISNAKIYKQNIAIALCEDTDMDTQLIVAQAADELLNIRGIEAAFVLAEVGGKIVISGRSLDSINVQVILEKLGGGGHITIAGAQLKNNTISFAEMKLKEAIDEVLFDAAPVNVVANNRRV